MATRSRARRRIAVAILALLLLGLALRAWIERDLGAAAFVRTRAVLQRPLTRPGVTGLTFPPDNPGRMRLLPVRAFPELKFKHPVMLLEAPDDRGRLYVVERHGTVRSFSNSDDARETELFLDIRDRVWSAGGSGLLGMAFDPDFADNGTFYVHYSTRDPRTIVVSAMQVRPDDRDHADPDSERVMIRLEKTHHSHNGGMLAFGPDGMLYVAIGSAMKNPLKYGRAQDLTSLLGKLLRIDPMAGTPYGIPPDNPFVGAGSGVREEIWAYGFRQPWRFCFDPQSGDILLGEVGNNQFEEINLVRRGGNYGWVDFEGRKRHAKNSDLKPEDTEFPILELPHSLCRAVIGGYVSRDENLEAFRGAYFYGDHSSGRIWALRTEDGAVVANDEVSFVSGITSFAEDASGRLFALALSGRIWRFEDLLDEVGSTPFPQLLSETGLLRDTESLQWADGLLPYDVISPSWADGAAMRRWIALPSGQRIGADEDGQWTFPLATVLVQHLQSLANNIRSAWRLETRVLVHETSGWAGYTYRWNAEQTDARLVTVGQIDPTGLRVTRDATEQIGHFYPSASDCMRCHNPASGPVLGLRREQLDFAVRYHDGIANQLGILSELDLFEPGALASRGTHPLVDPADPQVSVDARARSYLDTNCSNCHRQDGPADLMDLRRELPMAATNTLQVRPQNGKAGIRVIIDPDDRKNSYLWYRLRTSQAKHRMPPVGTARPDPLAKWLIGQWIENVLPETAKSDGASREP